MKFKRFLSVLVAVFMVIAVMSQSLISVSAAETISLNRPLDTAYTITAREYYSDGDYHGAIDYACPKGTPVYAAESGTITIYDGGYGDGYYGCKDGSGWGNYADISHDNGYSTRYAHMSTGRFVVSSGSYVQRGQLIGYSGNSGNSTGAHLHFGLYLNGSKVYPEPYIKTATGYFSNVPSHTVDTSYGTNFTAYPKAKITAENIFDSNHNQISSSSWIGTSDLCTIHEVYTDGCCKVTYPLDSGGTKTVYSKISLFKVSSPKVKYWISDTEYGDVPSEFKAGNRYYFCYRFYDVTTGKNWDEVEDSDYTFNLTFYNPDGSVKYTNQSVFNDDESWISSFFSEPGTYTAKIVMSGDYTLEGNLTFTVQENPLKVNCSTNSVSLKLGETESQTVYVGYSGYYSGDCALYWERSNSNVSCTWGEWTDDHRMPVTIKANAMGTTIITFSMKDKDTGVVVCSTTVTVTVGAKSYTVTYNANGGSGAPGSQTKYHNTTLALSSTKPTRSGYTFLGWATSSTATSATYQPGGSFTENANTTLYAVWEQGCENGAHSYSYKVTNSPTASATGTLTGTCSKCSGTTTVTLPKLNTMDYTYEVTKAATCEDNGTGRYIWKITTYGSFDFYVIIFATGHSYTNKVTAPTCTEQGYTTHTCTNCGDVYVDSYVKALGHSYGEWYVVTDATCEKDGQKRHDCQNCAHYETAVIEAGGHEYETVVIEPTCSEWGYTVHTCAHCGHSYTDNYVEIVDHDYQNGSCKYCGKLEVAMGDANGDGKINTTDAKLVMQYELGMIGEDDLNLSAVDVNGDGKINTTDAKLIMQLELGMITEFPKP